MAGVTVRNLSRQFGANRVLDALDLDLAPGSFVALLGRSGSGKTTLLRTLAGLDPASPDAELSLPRPVAAVFQEPRLLPWKSVWRNVALGLDGPGARDRAGRACADPRDRPRNGGRLPALGQRLPPPRHRLGDQTGHL